MGRESLPWTPPTARRCLCSWTRAAAEGFGVYGNRSQPDMAAHRRRGCGNCVLRMVCISEVLMRSFTSSFSLVTSGIEEEDRTPSPSTPITRSGVIPHNHSKSEAPSHLLTPDCQTVISGMEPEVEQQFSSSSNMYTHLAKCRFETHTHSVQNSQILIFLETWLSVINRSRFSLATQLPSPAVPT